MLCIMQEFFFKNLLINFKKLLKTLKQKAIYLLIGRPQRFMFETDVCGPKAH